MASEDEIYRQSSQFRLWSFSPAQLANLRTQTNALAQASIAERRRRREEEEEGEEEDERGLKIKVEGGEDHQHHQHNNGDRGRSQSAAATGTGAAAADIAYLTPAEERLLLDFYTVELLRAAQFTEQPTDVQATAAVFLRRFYITHSLMTYPPAALFKTALFFGAKAEGYYHKLAAFADKFPNTTAADIVAGEFLLCQGLRFAFDVKHPFRALEGAIMELRRLQDASAAAGASGTPGRTSASEDSGSNNELTEDRIAAAHRRARAILKFSSLVTDAYFHYTPAQIMLAALWLADRGLVERLLLQETFRRATNGGGAETTPACAALLAAEPPERFTAYWGQPESNNLIKPLLRKLKTCRDPDRWDLVALQQAKKAGPVKTYAAAGVGAEAEADGAVFGTKTSTSTGTGTPDSAHEAKRRRVLDDPFGPPLRG
ncbi:cyclin-like protein [Niveomyces insectorum RCEF 264]|uniref:Cyclin-like protein n=1 Tax=Niveomyces insectorum RCEF 264 TaxID=1081102 RepID=A0A167XZG4_9HYPO|nr:cyclin-like protein [Niveomyces insectorum RCEF 264]